MLRFFQGLGALAAVELEAGDGRVVADEVLRDAPVTPHDLTKVFDAFFFVADAPEK